jgi:signal peptide peptidase SppA
MINPILSYFEKEVWAMEPTRLASLYNQFLNSDSIKLAELMKIEITKNKQPPVINNGVMQINIHGLLMKNPPGWLAWFGIETTDYIQLAEQLKAAVENPEVKSIMLHIDSPGGAVGGVSEAAEAIANANKIKPVNAYIEDLGASGAYYLASQAGHISINPNGEAGSIGVYTVAVDSSALAEKLGLKVHVIRSGEHKGMGVGGAAITENQIAAEQEIVDGMAANFKAAVAAGRKMNAKDVEKIATGRTWLAAEAKKLNLVDEIINGINKSESKQGLNMKGQTMPETKSQQEIQKEAQAAEVQRMNDIKAAIPNDAAFAMEQFTKGASAVEAKAAYADKLQAQNAALQKENEDLQKTKAAKITPEGATPVAINEDGGNAAAAQSDFMADAKAYAKENKCSMKEAIKAVRCENPESYMNFREQSQNKKVKLGAEKVERIQK